MSESWKALLLDGDAEISRLLSGVRRVAVLGIRSEARAERPAHYVPAALARAGVEIVPVPVHGPDLGAGTILGRPVYSRLADVPGQVDLVDVFRRSEDVPALLPELLAARPAAVWMQVGIRHDATAEALARAGIAVVQDRCLMVEWGRLGPHLGSGEPTSTPHQP